MKSTHLRKLMVLLIGARFCAQQSLADYAGAVAALSPVLNYRLETTNQVPVEIPALNGGSLGTAFNGEYQAMLDTRGTESALAGDSDTSVSISGGSGQQVVIPYSPAYNPAGDFTVEFWAKPANTAANNHSVANSMVNGQNPGNANDRSGWTVRLNGGDWQFVLGDDHSDGVTFYHTILSAPGSVVAEAWQHVVAVYTASEVSLYLNGVSVASAAPTKPIMPNNAAPLILGDRGFGGWDYNGLLDELVIYTNALSPIEIKAHYDNGMDAARTQSYPALISEANPALYYRLGEEPLALPVATNTGSIGADGDGVFLSGTTAGVPGLRAPAVAGFEATNHAAHIDKAGSFVKIPGPALDINEVTFACWIKRDGKQSTRAGIIFQRAGDGSKATGLGFQDDGAGLSYHWNDAGNTYDWQPNLTVPDGVWTFVALAVQADSAVMYMGTASGFVAATNSVSHETHDFSIASIDLGLDPTSSTRNFTGGIDEVSVFDKALDFNQVKGLFTAALPGILSISRTPSDPVYEGSVVTFKSLVAGATTPTYQWFKDGVALPGRTASTLALNGVTVADSGVYSLVVKSGASTLSETSSNLSVVSSEPRFSSVPGSATKYLNGSVRFEAGVYGSVPLTYQWKHGAEIIPGAESPVLFLSDLRASDSGDYTLVAMNPLGTNEVTATLTLATPSMYGTAVTDLGPIGYWQFNESDGTNVVDKWGARDGFISSSVTKDIDGPTPEDFKGFASTNKAYDFTSGTTLANATVPALNLNKAAMTIVAWIKPNGVQGDYAGLVFSRAGGTVAGLDYTTAGQIGYHWNGEASTYNWASGLTPADGVWNFVALVVEPSKATMYLDSGAGIVSSENVVTHAAEEFDGPIKFGSETATGRPFKGAMDEIAIYDHPLSADQITALRFAGFSGNQPEVAAAKVIQQPKSQAILVGTPYTFTAKVTGSVPMAFQWQKDGKDVPGAVRSSLDLGSTGESDTGAYQLVVSQGAVKTFSEVANLVVKPIPTFLNATNDLVLHLKFDSDYQDSSGRGNHGAANGEPKLVAGQVGGALEYNTDSEASIYNYVSLGSPEDLQFPADVSFSVAYWVKFTGKPGDLPFLSSANNSYGNPGLTFAPSYGGGGWSYWIGGDTGSAGLYGADNSINDGTWHSLVHVFDRASQAITYLDGVIVDARSMDGVGAFDNANGLFVGQAPPGSYGESATSELDDLGIWRRALTEYEAKSISIVGRLGRSFDSVGQTPVTLTAQKTAGGLQLSWTSGTLESAPTLDGPWLTVPGATAPGATLTPSGGSVFYRVKVSN